jgi:hypothetical protein
VTVTGGIGFRAEKLTVLRIVEMHQTAYVGGRELSFSRDEHRPFNWMSQGSVGYCNYQAV